jgi:hypothetical protein
VRSIADSDVPKTEALPASGHFAQALRFAPAPPGRPPVDRGRGHPSRETAPAPKCRGWTIVLG